MSDTKPVLSFRDFAVASFTGETEQQDRNAIKRKRGLLGEDAGSRVRERLTRPATKSDLAARNDRIIKHLEKLQKRNKGAVKDWGLALRAKMNARKAK